MASYLDLKQIKANPGYPDWAARVEFAISVSAETIAKDPQSTAGKDDWARKALGNEAALRPGFENYVLADNRSSSVQQILEATDLQIQEAVDEAVAALVPDAV